MNNLDNIRETILRNKKPSYLTTDRKEIRVRCPYCNDSSGHFYIKLSPPFLYHCFKCESSGSLNNQTLRDLEIYDNDINLSIISADKEYKANTGIQRISLKKKTLINESYYNENSKVALNYFNNRYGMAFDEAFITKKFKTILSPTDFFMTNNINPPRNQYNFSKAIGFISSDSSHIIFRDISNQQKTRYFNLNLYGQNEINSMSKIYNISQNLDFMQLETELIITEGIFDIIGVYSHFYRENDNNKIFAAACGKGYLSVILNYIRLGFLNMNITIYSDADVNREFYVNMKKSSPYLKNKQITIFYNSLYDPKTKFGKDYGVRAADIQLKKIII